MSEPVGFVICQHCNGRGRVVTTDVRPIAAEVWEKHKDDPRYPLIAAVKELRERAGLHLADAKDIIDEVRGA